MPIAALLLRFAAIARFFALVLHCLRCCPSALLRCLEHPRFTLKQPHSSLSRHCLIRSRCIHAQESAANCTEICVGMGIDADLCSVRCLSVLSACVLKIVAALYRFGCCVLRGFRCLLLQTSAPRPASVLLSLLR